ncbi:DinB family protein [Streptomyces sp. NPDC020794]|uniref:DinB family protein n=1 Tax=unclassified Streptomyces TaxID=2593676 RepID=UPI0036E5A58A
MSRVRIVDSWLVDVDVSGHVSNFVVNGVDGTAFVAAELDQRHPERVQLRGMRTADDHRAMWDTIERLWSDAVTRAERLPEAARHQRVHDEWSFVESLRHLVFVTDAWARRTILDEPLPYHPFGVPQSAYPRADAAALGIDLAARPSFAEVMSARADRMALVRGLVDALTDSELVMDEECEHLRFAVRDLATLEAASQGRVLTGSRAGRDRLTRPARPA